MLPYLAKVENEKINFSKFLDRYPPPSFYPLLPSSTPFYSLLPSFSFLLLSYLFVLLHRYKITKDDDEDDDDDDEDEEAKKRDKIEYVQKSKRKGKKKGREKRRREEKRRGEERRKRRQKVTKINRAKLKEWQKETMGYMCANMHAMVSTSLPDAFAKFDKDKDGKLSYKEFMDALESLRMYPIRRGGAREEE